MTRHELLKKALTLPELPGVYIMRDKSGEVIYVGKAKRLVRRVSSYFREGAEHLPKVEKMVQTAFDFDVIVVDSEFEALTLECSLIKQHRPKYNILMMDDKGFSYIRISNDDFPRITAALQKNDDGARYIGPYISSYAVKSMVETANTVFRLPTCQVNIDSGKQKRACLNSHIGLCCAPCTGSIPKEEYMETIESAVMMLTKETPELVQHLQKDMENASENLQFEKAARIRDSIFAIKKLEAGQKVVKEDSNRELDVFAFAGNEKDICVSVLKYRGGRLADKVEKVFGGAGDIDGTREEFVTHYYLEYAEIPKEILLDAPIEYSDELAQWLSEKRGSKVKITVPQKGERKAICDMAYSNAIDRLNREAGRKSKSEMAVGELAGLLGLEKYPERIEVYDISNYGAQAVGGMAVFYGGEAKKSEYRCFRIKTVEGVDDYASMSEVILRRLGEYNNGTKGFCNKPDVIFLDGGKGHLDTITQILTGTEFADVPLFGLVKNQSHRTRAIVSSGGEISLSLHKRAFNLVSSMQDEVHRFTINYERKSHTKKALKSSLEEIDGIGEKRAKALMKAFGTMEAIENASLQKLENVEGITKDAAQKVWNYFHP